MPNVIALKYRTSKVFENNNILIILLSLEDQVIQKTILCLILTITAYAAPKVGDFVVYKVSNHKYNNSPESFTIKLEITRYDFISDSMRLEVTVRSSSGALIPTSSHWISPSYFDKQAGLGQIARKCSQGIRQNVQTLSGDSIGACKLDLIESAMSGAINPTSYLKFDYETGWVTNEVPITGMAKVMGKLWGAVLISHGREVRLPTLEHISDRQYFYNVPRIPSL